LNMKVDHLRPLSKEERDEKGDFIELWEVKFSNGEKRCYKGVIICIGHHWDKRIPQNPGQSEFAGQILHSKDYKDPSMFIGKRVLVVGGGNSACDINVEAAKFADDTHCSMRRGYWFLPRTFLGVPFVELVKPWFPIWLQRIILTLLLRLVVGSYESYGLEKPDHKLFEMHPTINTEILNYIKLGKIHPHRDIKQFDKLGVQFIDGKRIDFDVVVFATGYRLGVPFVDKDLIKYEEGIPQVVNNSIVPPYRNLFLIGNTQPRYGAGPLITVGGQVLAIAIKTQLKMKYPMYSVLKKIGLAKILKRNNLKASLRTDVLSDPHLTYKEMVSALSFYPKLIWIESWLIKLGFKIE